MPLYELLYDLTCRSKFLKLSSFVSITMRKRYSLSQNVKRKERKLRSYDNLATHGQRIDYHDYNTIDWFHDALQYKAYLRMPTTSAINWLWKEMQVWMLLFILGVSVGVVQVFLVYFAVYLQDIKAGYCIDNVLYHRSKCCRYLLGNCSSWLPWSSLTFFKNSNSMFVDFSIYFLFSLLFGYLAVAITLEFAYKQPNSNSYPEIVSPYGANSGLPEIKTILSGFIIRGYLGTRTLIVKIFGLLFAVASGLVLSVQGPLVHISCCIGNILSRFSDKYNRNEAKKRELLSCATAVGVSAAFGSPVGGVLFSLEETSYYFPSKTMIRSYFSAMVAALTVKLINVNKDRLVLFQVTQVHTWYGIELIPYALLGLFGGLFGVVFNDCVIYLAKYRLVYLQKFPILEVLVICTVTAVLSFNFDITQLSIPGLLAELFTTCTKDKKEGLLCSSNESKLFYLGYAFVIKTAMFVITTGLKVPGGTFLPTMMVGGLMGRALGHIFEFLLKRTSWLELCDPGAECIVASSYALVGSAAALSGVTRLTVSSVVIFYELTGNMHFVIPIMIATLVASWTANFFNKLSLTERQIEFNHLPFLNPKLLDIPSELPSIKPEIFLEDGRILGQKTSAFIDLVMDVSETCIYIEENNSTKSLLLKLKQNEESRVDVGFPILLKDKLAGFIDESELRFGLKSVRANGLEANCCFMRNNLNKDDDSNDFTIFVNYTPIIVSPRASQDFVLQLFWKLGIRYACVVDINGGFLGTIHKKRIVSYLSENIE
eukprot:NODE_439_length_8587_cov_0.367224.p1 type:complete len:769 gc:universal NODE_439_length_8587_cov_0.367224:2335-29(-)